MIPHHQGGCINCGNLRFTKQEIDRGIDLTSRNLYVTNSAGSQVIMGLCAECHASDEELNLEQLHTNVYQQELALLDQRKKDASLADPIRDMVFVGYRKQGR